MTNPPIIKYEIEEIPLIFDFSQRLGTLAAGARIAAVMDLSVTPTGDANDLSIGIIGEAALDEVTELAVQVRATKGRSSIGTYRPRCRVSVVHAGVSYQLVVELIVHVRA